MARVDSVSLVHARAISRSALWSTGTGKAIAKTAAHMAVQSAFAGASCPQPSQLSAGVPCIMPAMEARALAGPIIGMAWACALAMNARANNRLAARRIIEGRTRQLWEADRRSASRQNFRGDLSRGREDKPRPAPPTASNPARSRARSASRRCGCGRPARSRARAARSCGSLRAGCSRPSPPHPRSSCGDRGSG